MVIKINTDNKELVALLDVMPFGVAFSRFASKWMAVLFTRDGYSTIATTYGDSIDEVSSKLVALYFKSCGKGGHA